MNSDFGVLPIKQFRTLENQAANRPIRGTELGLGLDSKPRYLAKPGEPVDRLGRPLDGNQLLTFQLLSEFDDIRRELCRLLDRIGALAQSNSGVHLNFEKIAAQIISVQLEIQLSAPYAVCPSCSGTEFFDVKKSERCPTCRGIGFISEGRFESLNDDLRQIALGYQSTSKLEEKS